MAICLSRRVNALVRGRDGASPSFSTVPCLWRWEREREAAEAEREARERGERERRLTHTQRAI